MFPPAPGLNLRAMSLLVKICGITNLADAQAAVDAGADALGFMFYEPSARNIAPAAAREIIAQLPPRVAKVGVFVNAPAEVIHRMAAECGLDTVQLHGEETPEFCAQFAPLKVWKAVRVRAESSLRALPAYETDAWLLDSYVAGHAGGTGENSTGNWPSPRRRWAVRSFSPADSPPPTSPPPCSKCAHSAWTFPAASKPRRAGRTPRRCARSSRRRRWKQVEKRAGEKVGK